MQHDVKAACTVDLSFPYHQPVTAHERLTLIRDFMRDENLDGELFGAGRAAARLEQDLATMFGKQAAMWCPTGTMAQGIAARIYAARSGRERILLHPSSHLLLHEEEGYRHAHHLSADVVGSWRGAITADMLDGEAACAIVELPQRHSGGLLPEWSALEALVTRAGALGLPLHMDGARVWSCRPFYENRDFATIAAGFSSIYVSFYKDIGAMGGAALIGDADFIAEAKLWHTRLGGMMVAPWPMICDALRLLAPRCDQMAGFVAKARELAAAVTAALGDTAAGVRVDPAPPQVNMFHILLPYAATQAERARDQVARATGIWLGNRFWAYEGADRCALEVPVGEKAASMSVPAFAAAVKALVTALQA